VSRSRRARLPPRWFMVAFWHGHRALLRATGGRFGLWRPRPGGWGALRLTTTGRRSGMPRQVVVGYFEDGRNLVTMAMNGWGPAEPAWWLNLQDHPVPHRPDPRWGTAGPCAPRTGRRARAAVVPLGRDRQEPRRLRRPAANRDRRCRPRAARRRRDRRLTLPAERIEDGRGLRTSMMSSADACYSATPMRRKKRLPTPVSGSHCAAARLDGGRRNHTGRPSRQDAACPIRRDR
jgi:F420H(2)-dependent quinone reductase